MKILLVEDQEEKAKSITSLLQSKISESVVTLKTSLRSGIKEIIGNSSYDLLLLDMSLPRYDVDTVDADQVIPEGFAGKEILAQMDLRDIRIPVILVTQYSVFGENKIDLIELDVDFKEKYREIYLGHVYYSSASKNWSEELIELIGKCVGK